MGHAVELRDVRLLVGTLPDASTNYLGNQLLKMTLRRVAPILAIQLLHASCAPRGGETSAPNVIAVEDATGAPLGSIALAVSCNENATPHLNRGLALLHNMTYTEAEAEFRSAFGQDGKCVLAHWGVAMSYVHPLWPDVPSDEALVRGMALLTEARGLRPLKEHEDAYVSALEGYYRNATQRGEADRLASYAEGWTSAHARDPADLEAKLFKSLGMIAVAAVGEQRSTLQLEAGRLAEEVLAAIPDHTGALHYIIHAYDLPDLADRALPAAKTYGEAAPENSHALHMTSHIYTRVGNWDESVAYNRRAAQAALASPINGATSFHYLHAADYLAYAQLQRLDDVGARQVWDDMTSIDGPISDHPASPYAFAAVPARIALERRDWESASNLPIEWPASLAWDRYPHFVAISEFARGLGAARAGHLEEARTAVTRLTDLRDRAAALPGQYDWATQVEIQELAVRAWVEYESGNDDEALSLMRRASDLEADTEKNPVTPGEVLPAAELLGDMLVEMGHYPEAIEAYESALERSPNRFNSLYGAGLAAERSGADGAAREYYARLVDGAIEAPGYPPFAHARRYLEGA